MAKLYSVKEIAQMLNGEFEGTNIDYRYSEERVRARLRYARSKGTITPKRMGFDRRAKYYTLEDVEKIKSEWIGPMPTEFTEYVGDLETIDPGQDEIEIRAAKLLDIEPILKLFSLPGDEAERLKPYLSKSLKSNQHFNFVALYNDNEIIGWSQAEISSGLSMVVGKVVGVVRIFVPSQRKERTIASRSLVYRAENSLRELSINHIILELAVPMRDLNSFFIEQMHFEESGAKLMQLYKFPKSE